MIVTPSRFLSALQFQYHLFISCMSTENNNLDTSKEAFINLISQLNDSQLHEFDAFARSALGMQLLTWTYSVSWRSSRRISPTAPPWHWRSWHGSQRRAGISTCKRCQVATTGTYCQRPKIASTDISWSTRRKDNDTKHQRRELHSSIPLNMDLWSLYHVVCRLYRAKHSACGWILVHWRWCGWFMWSWQALA